MKQPKQIELSPAEVEGLLDRVAQRRLEDRDYEIIRGLVETFVYLKQAVDDKQTSIRRLLRLLFGGGTESARNVLKQIVEQTQSSADSPKEGVQKDDADQAQKKPPKGHGRNGADAFRGAERIAVSHGGVNSGDRCPDCGKGKIYPMKRPGVLVRIVGRAPIQAAVYDLEKLRCNLCGEVFTAEAPEGTGEEKYDETVGSLIGLLKYGSGFPFHRIEQLQESLGMPLPASTQWEIVERTADRIYPVYLELIRQAAQGDVIHNDDTTMKILALMKQNEQKRASPDAQEESSRTGMFTTAILSVLEGRQMALFFSGRKHGGENMAGLLGQRPSGRAPPIQMCDALSRNLPGSFRTILANCLVHGRRNFIDVAPNFPEQCRYVIKTLGKVYKNDERAREENMSPEQRLQWHKDQSGPLMKELKAWLKKQFDEKQVEPNSSMGKAIRYMLKHWKPLTLFLRVKKAPLDNNVCERALKRTILHRKNSLFFKTEHGAYIGDIFMSLIHTCALMEVNPFDYLTALQKHSSDVFKKPHYWMPWNYETRISALSPNGSSR